MDLAEFHSQIDDLAAQGGVVDSQIRVATRHAAMWLERNYNFEYMKTQRLQNIPIGDAQTTILANSVKAFVGGELREEGELEGVMLVAFTRDPYAQLDTAEFEDKFPVLFGKNRAGQAYIRPLILTFSVAYDMAYTTIDRTTDWPLVTDPGSATGYTHFLLDEAEDVLTARTMLNLSAIVRDPELRQFYEEAFATGIKTLLDHEFQMELSDSGVSI